MSTYDPQSPAYIAWCRSHFNLIAEGGVWAVPRSGVVFRKVGNRLVLDSLMPYMPEMEGRITREQLAEQQQGEFETIRDHFAAAGIEVVKGEDVSDHFRF